MSPPRPDPGGFGKNGASGIRALVALVISLTLAGTSAMAASRRPNGSQPPPRDGQLAAQATPQSSNPARASRLPADGPAIREPHHARSGFAHPGVLVTVKQLEYVRQRVNAGQQPWLAAFDAMESSRYASLAWQPRPRPVVECGGYSVPDLGCRDESSDAIAAYTHALLWYLTGRRAHAEKAAEILDAWSAVLKAHTNSNAPLQAGWSAASFVRAAELVRRTYAG